MFKWINSQGETITTESIRQFSERFNFPYSMAKTLHCGLRSRLRGFCSTSPKAKKERERFMTVLVNTKTRERSVLGPSVKKFAKDRGLSLQGLSELVNGTVFIYKHWVLEKTLEAANRDTPALDF